MAGHQSILKEQEEDELLVVVDLDCCSFNLILIFFLKKKRVISVNSYCMCTYDNFLLLCKIDINFKRKVAHRSLLSTRWRQAPKLHLEGIITKLCLPLQIDMPQG